MSKAGKGDGVDAGAVGSQHPVPENIPHLSSPVNGGSAGSVPGNSGSIPKHGIHGSLPGMAAGSPVKEGSFLQRETSMEDGSLMSAAKVKEGVTAAGSSSEPLATGEGVPIRR